MLPDPERGDQALRASRAAPGAGGDGSSRPRLPDNELGLRAPAAPAAGSQPSHTCFSLSSISLLRADTSSVGIILPRGAAAALRRSVSLRTPPPSSPRHRRAAILGAAGHSEHAQPERRPFRGRAGAGRAAHALLAAGGDAQAQPLWGRPCWERRGGSRGGRSFTSGQSGLHKPDIPGPAWTRATAPTAISATSPPVLRGCQSHPAFPLAELLGRPCPGCTPWERNKAWREITGF